MFVLIWVVFGVRQSISHSGNAATLATVVVFGLFALLSVYCKGLMHVLFLLYKQHYYERPNNYGQLESADILL